MMEAGTRRAEDKAMAHVSQFGDSLKCCCLSKAVTAGYAKHAANKHVKIKSEWKQRVLLYKIYRFQVSSVVPSQQLRYINLWGAQNDSKKMMLLL